MKHGNVNLVNFIKRFFSCLPYPIYQCLSFEAFTRKAKRFSIALLFVFSPRPNFFKISGNSEQKNILETME